MAMDSSSSHMSLLGHFCLADRDLPECTTGSPGQHVGWARCVVAVCWYCLPVSRCSGSWRCALLASTAFFFLLLLLQGLVSNNAKNIRQGQLAPFFYQSSLQQEIPALDFTLKPKKLHGSKQKYQIPSLELRLGLHFCHTGMAKPKWVIPFSFLNSFCLKVLMLWTSAKNFWISFLWTFSDTACIPGTGNLPNLLPVIFFFF